MNPPPVLGASAVILDRNGTADVMPVNDDFWPELDRRHGDFAGKLLISSYAFEGNWPTWEIHPHGDELVQLVSGEARFLLEEKAGVREVLLREPGSFMIVPRNTWHTAHIAVPTRMLFITPGQDTRNRPV